MGMHAREVEAGGHYALAPLTGAVILKVTARVGVDGYRKVLFACEVVECPKGSGLEEGQRIELTADRLNERKDVKSGWYSIGSKVVKINAVIGDIALTGRRPYFMGQHYRVDHLGKRLTPKQAKEIQQQQEDRKTEHAKGVKAIQDKYPWTKESK